MKRVLILAYYAPPLGMGGTQRVAKFCEYLPEYGWQPVLLTVKDIAYYARDKELSRSLARTRVERTESLDPQRLVALLSRSPTGVANVSTRQSRWVRLATSLLVPDAKVGWLPFAVLRGVQLVRSLRIHAVLVTSPPHSAQLGGWLIARATGVPWMADFRDRWCAGEFQPGTTRVHRAPRALDGQASGRRGGGHRGPGPAPFASGKR
ncbi:MAG: glycosyltransferase family 4 protein [Calditrichaeota bacterium]|nr:glycosyltransferase family 4 protein [Calditrichota bacterium]